MESSECHELQGRIKIGCVLCKPQTVFQCAGSPPAQGIYEGTKDDTGAGVSHPLQRHFAFPVSVWSRAL